MKTILKQVHLETTDIQTFFLEPQTPFAYKPGQHLNMLLSIDHPDERGRVRPFSLSSSPTEKLLSITTKRGPSSFKQKLFTLPVGSVVDIAGPAGKFVLLEKDKRLHVMIAGGIGITPFRSMIKYACDTQLELPMVLLYSNKVPEEIVFRKELEEIGQTVPNIKIIETITKPDESGEKWTGRVGRIDSALIKQFVPHPEDANFYTAGPGAMVEAMILLLNNMGISIDLIHSEQFAGY